MRRFDEKNTMDKIWLLHILYERNIQEKLLQQNGLSKLLTLPLLD